LKFYKEKKMYKTTKLTLKTFFIIAKMECDISCYFNPKIAANIEIKSK